jgi:hypothetical protein
MVNVLLLGNKKESPFCEGYVFGKAKRSLFAKKNVKIWVAKIVNIVHIKLCGPFNTKSKGRASYYIILKMITHHM